MPMFHAGAALQIVADTAGGCSIRVVRDYDQADGMTECCAVATVLAPEDHRRALRSDPGVLASAGRPVIGSAVKVVSRDGVELPAGAVGEVLVHGEQLMSGYWVLTTPPVRRWSMAGCTPGTPATSMRRVFSSSPTG
ncbi:Acyl-CoA synthetases (AMP-forming)/AMP-acid ligases II [Gordonia terrae C-6]|uniref:Acyl-CoA synthetases (AMP-forming)/AMP-acid ligases II n=1 Tax=Gordonia terrae C-6 TaxID=1316928 RepID=R7YDH5_9ACTN|nr:AMP-binding protein [Gordonia terrae]EON34090.1 Acyl-CoA synthetases (AMP-forming)/AMP-acid ligases II [Gordonia terrae C-6]